MEKAFKLHELEMYKDNIEVVKQVRAKRAKNQKVVNFLLGEKGKLKKC